MLSTTPDTGSRVLETTALVTTTEQEALDVALKTANDWLAARGRERVGEPGVREWSATPQQPGPLSSTDRLIIVTMTHRPAGGAA